MKPIALKSTKSLVVSRKKHIFALKSEINVMSMKQLIAKIRDNHVFRGIASFGNIFGSPIRNRYARMSDLDMLRKDWEIIGNDLKTAINIYRKEVGYAR